MSGGVQLATPDGLWTFRSGWYYGTRGPVTTGARRRPKPAPSKESSMAASAVVSVASTATLIVGAGTNTGQYTNPAQKRGEYLLQNVGSVNVYLGGSGVTTGTGKRLQAGESISFSFSDNDPGLYGVVAAGTCNVDLLRIEP